MKTYISFFQMSLILLFCLQAQAEQPPKEVWVALYDVAGNSQDMAKALAVDDSGNVYVTGTSSPDGNTVTVKYNQNGKQLWSTSYDGLYSDLVSDDLGNVYVKVSTGDYEIVKYDPNGKPLWVARYNGPANDSDYASDLTIDDSRNVYVTGYSDSLPGDIADVDYATIKYDNSGNQLWVARYDGPRMNCSDHASALAVDSASNVYVTGYSNRYPGSGEDYTTIKYDTYGNQLWEARYNGQAFCGHDRPTAIAVDSSGNVYVTGASDSIVSQPLSETISAYDDAFVSSNPPDENYGSEEYFRCFFASPSGPDYYEHGYVKFPLSWDPIYDTITEATLRLRVYSTAYTVIGADDDTFVIYELPNDDWSESTITWNNRPCCTGDEIFSMRIRDLTIGEEIDIPIPTDVINRALSTDSKVSLVFKTYCPGCSFGGHLVAYAAFNSTENADGPRLILQVIRRGAGSPDYATVKYDAGGKQLWAARYPDQEGSWGKASALAIDDSGNVYITGAGYVYPGLSWFDYMTVKYDSDGNILWATHYNGPGDDSDYASDLTIDDSGNVYVTGSSPQWTNNNDYATIKYDPNGNQLWVVRYNGQANDNDRALAMAVDDSGNIYVTGVSRGIGTFNDYATIKYTQHGYCLGKAESDRDDNCKVDFTDFSMFAWDWPGNDFVDLRILVEDWLKCNFALEEDCW